MKKTTVTAATLLRDLARIISQKDNDCRRRLRQLELSKAKADKRIAKLERCTTRLTKKTEKRVSKLEARNDRLAKKVIRHTREDRPRQRQRHVKHNLTLVQKARLLQVWDKYHTDEQMLDRQSYALAKGLKLHRQRQVLKWFHVFTKMPAASRKLLRRRMKQVLAKAKD